MYPLTLINSLMLSALLLALCVLATSAPTHHLTIGVQGNTPTLIVTSSEIGITPDMLNPSKKFAKTEFLTKPQKDLITSEKHKALKQKVHKTFSPNNKKEKLQYLAKPFAKNISLAEATTEKIQSSSKEDNSMNYSKEPLDYTKPPVLKHVLSTFASEMETHMDRKNTSTVTFKKDSDSSAKYPQIISDTPLATTTVKPNEEEDDKKNTVKMANQGLKDIEVISLLPTKSTVEMSTYIALASQNIPTVTTTSPPKREIKHGQSKVLQDISSTRATSFSQEAKDLTSTLELSDALGSKKIDDFSTTTTYADTLNTVTTSTSKAISTSEIISTTTSRTTTKQIAEEATTIKTEKDNDTTTENPTTLRNEHLLLPTTTAMTKTDNTVSPPPALFTTFVADDAATTTSIPLLSVSLTTTTTMTTRSANNVDDNEQNATEPSETATNMKKANNDFDDKAERAETRSIHDDNNKIVKIKTEQAYGIAIKAKLSPNSGILSHTPAKTLTTENPLPSMTVQTMENFQTTALDNQQSVIKTETDITTSVPFAEQIQQQTTTDMAMHPLETTPNLRVNDGAAIKEKVLKLIDLEKHSEEIKQASLTAGNSHDNGHDGLKNIKKKQLIDKHYIEDLVSNKHDDNHKSRNLQQTTPSSIKTVLSNSTTTLSPLINVATTGHLLLPIKHGYLGPILMEEKTFHVIHHAANNHHEMTNKAFPLSSLETKLRTGHFVELKAKSDIEPKVEATTSILNKQETSRNSIEFIGQSDPQKFIAESIGNKYDFIITPKQFNITHAPEARTHTDFRTPKKLFNNTKAIFAYDEPNKDEMLTNPKYSRESSLRSSILTDYANPKKQIVEQPKSATVLSSTLFQIVDTVATKTPILQANTTFTSDNKQQKTESRFLAIGKGKTESKISDIQIEIYDSTIDSIVGSTNFKDNDNTPIYLESIKDELSLGKTTKPPVSSVQQEKFTQYVIDRTETSTQESINFSTIQVASGKPEPAAIEIHINVSESFGNESEDLEFSYPQTEYNNNERAEDESYDDSKANDNIKLKVPLNGGTNSANKEARSDEILVVEIIDTDNTTVETNRKDIKSSDDLFISDNTPPPPPPPPPYQANFDRDSDTIFYISNTEVKVGESLASPKSSDEERKLKLESQFFPANYMASTHPNMNTQDDSKSTHHLYEEDIILSSNSNRNQADSLKIYRNRNEPSPPLDVTYVGESIIEVEQSPDSAITTTYVPEQQHLVTQQADVIIQPAILPEISIGVPVIGELPPQIELKEIDFMPNEAQLHRSGIYEENDNSNYNNNNNNNNIYNNDIEDNTVNAASTGYGYSHDVDNNNNQRLDESSIQYGGDLIDESADGGFDGVEGSYPFGNLAAAAAAASSSGLTKTHKQQPNHVADYAHLYVNYGVNNMRKDELSADVKDSGELMAIGVGGGSSASVNSNEQNLTSFKEFLNRVSMNNSTFINGNFTQTERMSNATAFSVMDVNDLQEKNTEDIVNLISLGIGLFIVILPVVVTCSMFWALRYLYKKYHTNINECNGYSDQTASKGQMREDGVEKGELVHDLPSSSPTNSDKDAIQKFPDTSNKPSTTDNTVKFSTDQSTNLDQQTTCSKTDSISSASKAKFSLQLSLALETHHTEIYTAHDEIEMPGPNGSITKMTLENNLLIVETEERNDMSRVARETKMDYNKDGVFVVEVARGIDSKTIPESPVAEDSEKMLSMFETKYNNGALGYKIANEKNCLTNEKVQIHSPPPENSTEDGPRSLHQIEEVDEPINSPHFYGDDDAEIIAGLAYKSHAGLSQSDLSTTSSNDSNKGYSYGNQALYVVEQNGYTTTSPRGNMILKCVSKDIKDEDHNPENDHSLENSPDKTDNVRYKEDLMETIKKQENSGKQTDQGRSPQQKQNGRTALAHNDVEILSEVKIEVEQLIVIENKICLNSALNETCNDEEKSDLEEVTPYACPTTLKPSDLDIPNTENPPEESISKSQELILCDETYSVTEISLSIEPAQCESLNDETLPLPIETKISVEANITNGQGILDVPEKFSDSSETGDGLDNENNSGNELVTEIVAEKELTVSENGFAYTDKITLELNGVAEKKAIGMNLDEDSRTENKLNLLAEDKILENGLNHHIDMKLLNNCSETLSEKVTEFQSNLLQNGDTDSGPPSDSLTDMENGYDSIMSLPEPPANTEEQLNSDLSEQQLDSLPPPPPPESFNLKDLPPPQTNGDTDSLPSEESNNFYNTLPPPPPTTLAVTATNGRMHASPLTPPASPPARFTNNLHAGLCAQPIAVDVNGS